MSLLTLDIEKAAAGGRMLARNAGQVVLVAGAIPGERVVARLERKERGVAFAEVAEVLQPSADRRAVAGDARCGGNVFAHIEYARQLTLKSEIIQDAFRRIGRIPLAKAPSVVGSPERGYRMRARLHVTGGRVGFFLEGTHQVCDVASTGQLLPETADWVAALNSGLSREQMRGLAAIEVAENIPGRERACHLELHSGTEPRDYAAIGEGLTGLSAQLTDRPGVVQISGTPVVTDSLQVADDPAHVLSLSREVRAFFQGNRFLIESLVRHVAQLVPRGPLIDLYAGVGLFGLSLATVGCESVTAVEGDPVAGADLERNAARFGDRARAVRRSVESYLMSARKDDVSPATVIVDPPRTGISKDALAHLIRLQPSRIVYISCDVATLARDTRALHDGGYGLADLSGIDLFPNTAHVESIAVLTR
ncbi:MAG TPA: RsmD family RNA methyltransferase [Vicinamibacterales bacterium]|nr:RsmD family RNA methyltransferase [Vicinamibacterales bacterium]